MRQPQLRPRVFVVDDENMILELMDRILRAHDFDPVTFPSGRDALERAQSDPPSLVLLDLHMPEMSGEEFIRTLRLKSPERVPVLILSGDRLANEEIRALDAEGAIQKPFEMASLLHEIRTLTATRA